jgi:serine/threonine-protein kinase
MTLENSLQQYDDRPRDEDSFTGRTIEGYKIGEKLGEGAIGAVYIGEKNNQKFALKILKHQNLRVVEALREGLKNEFNLMKSVKHPNCIEALEYYENAVFDNNSNGPVPLIVMEYNEGAKPLDISAVKCTDFYRITTQLVKGLKAIHKAGRIHRDLKPANILITPEGKVKITDFGLSQIAAEHTDLDISMSLSMFSQPNGKGIAGSLGYFPSNPEEHKNPDKSFDMYSLGVVLYQIIIGEKEFPDPDTYEDVKEAANDKKMYEADDEPNWKITQHILKSKNLQTNWKNTANSVMNFMMN